MIKITNELKKKLLASKSAEEVTELIKADGQEITQEDVANLWDEIAKNRKKQSNELSLDELEAVSGGADRDWLTDGCAASVEAGSWCVTNDACVWVDVTYDHEPEKKACPQCGGQIYNDRVEWQNRNSSVIYHKCLNCGYEYQSR